MKDNTNTLVSANKILVLAPHPGDESLGCGGTIARYSMMGKELRVLIISTGNAENAKVKVAVDLIKEEAQKACKILGVNKVDFMDFPDGTIHNHYDDVKQGVMNLIQSYNPDIIFSPSPVELHVDHMAMSKITLSLLGELGSFKAAFYEIHSPVRYNCKMDITDTIGLKEKAVLCYKASLLQKSENTLNAIKGLNVYRSFDSLRKGFFEAFYVLTVGKNEDEIIDWLTYGLTKEASSYKLLSQLKKVDRLLAEYQQGLKKINELGGLLRERDEKIEQLERKCNTTENINMLNVVHSLYRIRDKILPYNSGRRGVYDKIVRKIKKK